MVCVVAPVDHDHDANGPASSVIGGAERHVAVGPVMLTAGGGLTVTTALPDDVPLQLASLSDVIVYVVVVAGPTAREASVPELMTCGTPSDHMMLNGAVPVSVALMVAEPPAQIAVVPLTAAAGCGLTEMNALPDAVPPQFASLSEVTL